MLPVADPNIFSMSQRVSLAQEQLRLATSNPQMHNMYMAYRGMYEAIGVKDIDRVLPPPPPNQPKDPALEHIDAMGGKSFQAFPGQDHRAHITAHLNFMSSNFVRNNPSITAASREKYYGAYIIDGTRTGTTRVSTMKCRCYHSYNKWLYKIHKHNNSYSRYLKR